MISWLRHTAVLTGMELRRLFRSQEIYRYCLIPATFGLSVVMALSVMIASALIGPERVVAVPLDWPDELPLVEALEEEQFEVVWAADPSALFDAGEVQAALVRWVPGDGIHGADRLGYGSSWRWHLEARALERRDQARLERAVEQATDWALDEAIVVAGGDPDAVLVPASVKLVVDESDRSASPFQRGAFDRAFPLFLMVSLAFFLFGTGGIADRRAGLTESLLTTPVGTTSVLAARALSTMVVQVLVIALVLGNMTVFLGTWVFTEDLAATVDSLLTMLSILFAANAILITATQFAPSGKASSNWAGAAMGAVQAAMIPALLAELPPWVPIGGGLHASGGWAWISAVEHVAIGLVVLLAASRLLDRFPAFKAGSGERGA